MEANAQFQKDMTLSLLKKVKENEARTRNEWMSMKSAWDDPPMWK